MISTPFEQFLNLEICESSAEKTIVAFPRQEITLNFGGTLHGGASMSIVNMAAKHALFPLLSEGERSQVRALDQSVRFTSTARGEKVFAEAVVITHIHSVPMTRFLRKVSPGRSCTSNPKHCFQDLLP